ncbi:MAG: hypothetical protein E7213_03365 [Clostridium sp.]|nr:hypothetical protein [Clostridium sp.]
MAKLILKKYMNLFKKLLECSLMSDMEYKVNFILRATVEFSYLIIGLVFFEVIFMNIDSIGGWGKYEVFMLAIITNLFDSVITMFFQGGLSTIPQYINDGSLDLILLKPVNKRFYLTFSRIIMPQVINLVLNLMIMIYVLAKMDVTLTIGKVIMFVLLCLIGVAIMYNILFLIMIVSFWTIKVDIGVNLFYQLFNIGNKPMTIFSGLLQKVFLYIVPIFIAFSYPIAYLQGAINAVNVLIAVGITIILFIFTNIVFKRGLKKYSSACS